MVAVAHCVSAAVAIGLALAGALPRSKTVRALATPRTATVADTAAFVPAIAAGESANDGTPAASASVSIG
jgi:hypothetical protein